MGQQDYIKDIARFGLENDQEKLLSTLTEFIEHNKNSKKVNFALQLQSLLKDSIRKQQHSPLQKVGSPSHYQSLHEVDHEIHRLKSD